MILSEEPFLMCAVILFSSVPDQFSCVLYNDLRQVGDWSPMRGHSSQ